MLIRTIFVALLLTVACDPDGNGAAGQVGKTAAVAGKAAATPIPSTVSARDARPKVASEAEDRAAYSSCLREQSASPTPGGTAVTAVVDSDPVEYVAGCMGRCYSDGKRSESCTSACKTAVAALPAAPSAGVLDSLGTCLDACHGGEPISETNRATCGLNCTQAARVAGPAPPATAMKTN